MGVPSSSPCPSVVSPGQPIRALATHPLSACVDEVEPEGVAELQVLEPQDEGAQPVRVVRGQGDEGMFVV